MESHNTRKALWLTLKSVYKGRTFAGQKIPDLFILAVIDAWVWGFFGVTLAWVIVDAQGRQTFCSFETIEVVMSASLSALCLLFAGHRSEQARLLRHHGGMFPMLGATAGILSYIAMQFMNLYH